MNAKYIEDVNGIRIQIGCIVHFSPGQGETLLGEVIGITTTSTVCVRPHNTKHSRERSVPINIKMGRGLRFRDNPDLKVTNRMIVIREPND